MKPDQSPSDWDRTMDLFDQLVQSNDPQSLLAHEPDDEVKNRARRLWEHHKAADGEGFLNKPVEVQLAPVLSPGQLLADRFEVERMVGRGGMGEVYQAFDRTMAEMVALKTIARWLADDERARQRFLAEVQNARRVTHPNVCRIHEIFQDAKSPFYTMELLKGRLLSERLHDTQLPPSAAKGIVLQLAEGLQAAHENGVVHGDFKPANIMLTGPQGNRPVIMDFGLARAIGSGAATSKADLRGGSGDYMAPELRLAEGAPSPASDIYAFGKVARQLAPAWESLWKSCTEEDPAKRPSSLKFIIEKLNVDVSRRYLLGAAAFVSAGAIYYASWARSHPSAQPLPSGARVLLNGFRAVNAEQAKARLTRAMTLTALAQSARLHTVADLDLLPALKRIKGDADLPVEGRVLQLLLDKLRASFWIDAELSQAGGRHALLIRVLRGVGQETLAQTHLRDVASLALLAEQAALWLRQSAGESQQSLQANSLSLLSQMSAVPEALEAYYEAMSHFAVAEMSQAEPLLEEAVRLDPSFAQAHSVLGIAKKAAGQYEPAFNECEKGMQLANDLPVRERTWIEANYYMLEEDLVQSVESARRNLAYYPDEPRCQRVLAYALMRAGSPAEAIPYSRKAVELSPQQMLTRADLIFNLAEAGEFEESLKEFRQAVADGGLEDPTRRGQRMHTDDWIYQSGALALLGLERYDEARQAFARTPGDRERAWGDQSVNAMQGRFAEVRTGITEFLSGATGIDEVFQAHEFGCAVETITGNIAAARTHLHEMANLEPIPPMTHLLDCAVFWAGRLGDADALQTAGKALSQIVGRWPNSYTRAVQTHARAIETLQQNDFVFAERLLLEASGAAFSVWALFDVAEFYTQRNPRLAEDYWIRLESYRGTMLARWFPASVVIAWLDRARAAHAAGNKAMARQYARKVLDHWGTASPAAAEAVRLAHKIFSDA